MMTVDEYVESCRKQIDFFFESKLDEFENVMRDHGATAEEIETVVRAQYAEYLPIQRAALERVRNTLAKQFAPGGYPIEPATDERTAG